MVLRALAAAALLLASHKVAPAPTPEAGRSEARNAIEKLQHEYAIDVKWNSSFEQIDSHGAVRGGRPKDEQILPFVPFLSGELARYPKSIFSNGMVKTIVLADKVTQDGHRWGGLALTGKATLLVDVSATWNEKDVRRTLHHEIFHLIDPVSNDDAWTALNGGDFRYTRMSDKQMHAPNKIKGFLTSYSRVSAVEDRAELFSFMITDPDTVNAARKRDAILSKKVDALKDFTSVEEMGDGFWSGVGLR